MNLLEAKTLLSNLLERVETREDGSLRLPGLLTRKERESLVVALSSFDGRLSSIQSDADKLSNQPIQYEGETLKLNMKSLKPPPPPSNMRLCFDFGTAMSKVTLVKDKDDEEELDKIAVLELGIPGDQEEISKNMLVSSVYIDDDGALWFGQKAVEMSNNKMSNELDAHERLDSIKSFLSKDDLNKEVAKEYNPTTISVTYHDIILAYLMFLTWAACVCAEKEGCPRNINRRFAIPCFEEKVRKKVEAQLRRLLGEAQLLADTFCALFDANKGIPLDLYLEKVKELRSEPREYEFITESIIEPLGVANTYFDSGTRRRIALVVDVGAGTTDMALFCFWRDEKEYVHKAEQIAGSSRTLPLAGDYLDQLLMDFILASANIDAQHPNNESIRRIISLKIRGYKEFLFEENRVYVYEEDKSGYKIDVNIDLQNFLDTKGLKKFSGSLKSAMCDILENIDQSFIDVIIGSGVVRGLVVILTGGGAKLPMIKKLASESLCIRGQKIDVEPALPVPGWLEKDYQDIAPDYPRVAVSVGGARNILIENIGSTMNLIGIAAPPIQIKKSITGS